MKKILLFFAIIPATFGMTQQLETVSEQLKDFTIYDLIGTEDAPKYRTTTCTADTVLYNIAKATGNSALSLNNSASAYAISQYYDAPTTLTIEGTQFIGRKANATGGTTIDVTVALYTAGADSMPTGTALATTILNIDTNFYGGSIAQLTKTATFSTPVDVSTPYVIVVENNTATPVTLYSSSYTAGDGDGEWLASANLFGTWTRSYDLVVSGTPYDADMFFSPIVSYDIDNDFSLTPDCGTPGTVTFDVTNSPLLQNRMYSSAVFDTLETDQYSWNWGDGSAIENILDTDHIYATAGPFNVTYTDTLFGWMVTCTDFTTKSTCSTSGLSTEEELNVVVYPNPATDILFVTADQSMELIQLFDISGKLVLTNNVVGQTQANMDLNNLSAGSYILRVKLADGNVIEQKVEKAN